MADVPVPRPSLETKNPTAPAQLRAEAKAYLQDTEDAARAVARQLLQARRLYRNAQAAGNRPSDLAPIRDELSRARAEGASLLPAARRRPVVRQAGPEEPRSPCPVMLR